MPLNSLEDLYVEELKDLYSAESQIVRALPKMAKAASSPDLQAAFREHLDATREHVARLEQICEQLGTSPKGKKCKGMEGLLEEGAELIEKKSKADPDVLDAALIGAAQRVEHYEMAAYGTVRSIAEVLGQTKQAKLLQRTLDEEGETDKLLSQLADSSVNQQAMAGSR